jgi:16S rRNA (cytosine1402-N4)-methyltransferase
MTEPRLERNNPQHYSVMLDEVLEALNLQDQGTYLDCTFGRGGYSKGVLEALGATKIIALDRDATAREAASEFEERYGDRFSFHPVCFDQMAEVVSKTEKLDGIMFDLGVSSPQLDLPERGFSFRFEGPLDMRMGTDGITAADVVNTYDEKELADLIYLYGEEKSQGL